MADDSANPFAPWWLTPWLAAAPAAGLTQPILPGWTFGNVIVDQQNSSAPDTERRIVAADSYGRQIGRLLDAVCALVEAQGAGERPEYRALLDLRDKVEAIKTAAASDRVDQFVQDLERLKAHDEAAFGRAASRLRPLVDAA